MDKIDDLAYDFYVSEQKRLQKQIWPSKKIFVEHRDSFHEYYDKFNILLRKQKIEKILNRNEESKRTT